MYTAEDYINFIKGKRFDKMSNYGMEIIAERFQELKQLQKTPPNSNYITELKETLDIWLGEDGTTKIKEELLNAIQCLNATYYKEKGE